MARKKKQPKKLAVFDFETDPFKHGRPPEPFCCGMYDGETYREWWGDDCVQQFLDFLEDTPDEFILYAHNGGKFDFYYLLRKGALSNPLKIINGRIAKCKIGRHELRDSYAIIPVPLAAYQKDEIDYNLFEREYREANKADILHYLASDCEYLYKLVAAFVERFGYQLTIGGTAIKKLKEFHPFENGGRSHDEQFRPYYFGGRVGTFETGVLRGDWKIYDVNSMYPAVMRNAKHPVNQDYTSYFDGRFLLPDGRLEDGDLDRPYFIRFTGTNNGALPYRLDDGGLTFDKKRGTFYACSHEVKIALKYGLIKIETVHEIRAFNADISFGEFVDTYQVEKQEGKRDGDKIKELFAKLLQNSSYGKTAQSSDRYKDFQILNAGEYWLNKYGEEYEGAQCFADYGSFEIWEKPSDREAFFDVAIGASITSAARAVLLEALQNATRPVYCDTDSIICLALDNVKIHKLELGAWDLEKTGDTLAIAGKKMYALFQNGEVVKAASKGVRISGAQILAMCQGEIVTHANIAPTFKLNGEIKFQKRRVKMLQPKPIPV